MEKLEEAVKYFKQNEGYARLIKGIKNKYISLGEIKGNITITKPTQNEKQALSGLMKKDYSKSNTITINLKKMQKAIDNTRFAGIELTQLIKGYFGEEIQTKKDKATTQEKEWNNFLSEILKQQKDTKIYKYIKESINTKDELYKSIKKYYNKKEIEKTELKEAINNACKGVNNLPKEITRIPVFATNTILNPHGFDKKNLCGRIFILLLCNITNNQYPKNSEELMELYYNNNLLVDDVSNMVLCKNIRGFIKNEININNIEDNTINNTNTNNVENNTNEEINPNNTSNTNKYEIHKGWEGFYNYNEPIFLTLYNISNINHIDKNNKYKSVIITENPAVFMQIMEKCKIKDFPLVCTYGQVKLAGIVLLDLLTKAGYKLYYSGDIDPEGLQIADKIKKRYKNNVEFLGFDIDTYYRNISNVMLPDNRLHKLEKIESSQLKILGEKISKQKKAAYEEKNIDSIIKFIQDMNFGDVS